VSGGGYANDDDQSGCASGDAEAALPQHDGCASGGGGRNGCASVTCGPQSFFSCLLYRFMRKVVF
jgi:hypothetical protein